MKSPIVNFYEGRGRDAEGRLLSEILEWSPGKLESVHDYIQWLFPLDEPSGVNIDAPVLGNDDIEVFRSSPLIRKNLLASFQLLMSFYGFAVKNDGGEVKIEKAQAFDSISQNWLRPMNHNFLRLTRIMKCLRLAGMDNYASALFNALNGLYKSGNASIIGERTFGYWESAVKGKNKK